MHKMACAELFWNVFSLCVLLLLPHNWYRRFYLYITFSITLMIYSWSAFQVLYPIFSSSRTSHYLFFLPMCLGISDFLKIFPLYYYDRFFFSLSCYFTASITLCHNSVQVKLCTYLRLRSFSVLFHNLSSLWCHFQPVNTVILVIFINPHIIHHSLILIILLHLYS